MKHKKLFLILALLCAIAQGTWAQTSWEEVYQKTGTTSDKWTAINAGSTTGQTLGSAGSMRIQPINMFGPRVMNGDDNAEVAELGIVPACIDHTDDAHGDMLFVECGTLGDDEEDAEDRDENQTQPVNTLIAGEKEKKNEYFDKIYVGFWDGTYLKYHPKMPHPYVDRHEIKPDNTYTYNQYSMRLTTTERPSIRRTNFWVNQRRKYTFSFLSDTVPEVRSIFLIHGKRYLAEKITATFSAETGMSQLMKIVCYEAYKYN